MDGDGSYQSMLDSLRRTLVEKIPGGLTEPADRRLQKSLGHYIKEVIRVEGCMDQKEVLRLTYDSMVSWFRRNTKYLSPRPQEKTAVIPEVHPDLVPGGIGMATIGAGDAIELEDDPFAILERMRQTRNAERFKRDPEATQVEKEPPAPAPPSLAAVPPVLQPKDFLRRQEDVVKYREVEYNLVLNSKDRDWLKNTKENRYNFSIQFNSQYRPQGTGMQPTVLSRLRNIVRVEFVKAIMPVEGLDVIVPRVNCQAEGGPEAAPENAFYSVLGLPFVTVNLNEFQGNNYGTNNTVDEALAVCQYDATWRSDQFQSETNMNRGYTLFFPKFMKAQRVYAPTPLANFQTLSFQLLNPENNPLSVLPDASPIANIIFSGFVDTTSCYGDSGDSQYIFIQMKEWFPIWSYLQLDRIQLAGLVYASTTANPSINAAGNSLIAWLQRPEGHLVVDVGYTTDIAAPFSVTAGGNDCGYANCIVIRNRFGDPTTGACSVEPWYSPTLATENEFLSDFGSFPASEQQGAALNLSRQVQLFLRVITRELDMTTTVRADNV